MRMLFLILLFSILPLSLQAQERTRVYLRYDGPLSEDLEELSMAFEGQVMASASIEFAGSADMEAVYAECRDEVGVSGSEERKCQLQAARRIFVEEVIEISSKKKKKGKIRLTLTVWSPETNGKVYGSVLKVDASDGEEGLEEGMVELGNAYLCFRGVPGACDGEPEPLANTSSPIVVEGGGSQGPYPDLVEAPSKVSTSPLSEGSRQIHFAPHEEGIWSLHLKDNTKVCDFPCSRWVDVESDAYVVGRSDSDGREYSRIQIPDHLRGSHQSSLNASLDLDDDWQDWEVNTVLMFSIGFPMLIAGELLFITNIDNTSSPKFGVGVGLFAVGAISSVFVAPIYGFYQWIKDDEKDHLILEDGPPIESPPEARGIGITLTF